MREKLLTAELKLLVFFFCLANISPRVGADIPPRVVPHATTFSLISNMFNTREKVP